MHARRWPALPPGCGSPPAQTARLFDPSGWRAEVAGGGAGGLVYFGTRCVHCWAGGRGRRRGETGHACASDHESCGNGVLSRWRFFCDGGEGIGWGGRRGGDARASSSAGWMAASVTGEEERTDAQHGRWDGRIKVVRPGTEGRVQRGWASQPPARRTAGGWTGGRRRVRAGARVGHLPVGDVPLGVCTPPEAVAYGTGGSALRPESTATGARGRGSGYPRAAASLFGDTQRGAPEARQAAADCPAGRCAGGQPAASEAGGQTARRRGRT